MADLFEKFRSATFSAFVEQGVPEAAAGAAMHAVHPLQSDVPCARSLEKSVRKRAKKFSRQLRDASGDEVGQLAIEALTDYRRMADTASDTTYVAWFDRLLIRYRDAGEVSDDS